MQRAQELELLLEPILGWRIWRVDGDGLLRGLLWGSPWAPRERFEARCEDSFPYWSGLDAPHDAPCARCTCGIYAFKRRRDAELLGRERADGAPLALGRVSLWGRVIETERG